jgi:hypothetical protein
MPDILMANHVHLLASSEPLSLRVPNIMLQDVGRHLIYRRGGTLWKGRFKADI